MKKYIQNMLSALLVTSVLLSIAPAQAVELVTYYHNDPLGSPLAASDEYGNELWNETYRPFGERVVQDAKAGNNQIWYTGKQQDSATGLSYYGARYYDPVLGRFMAIDPVGFQENDQTTFNKYAYVGNNPYKFIDPDGQQRISPMFGGSRVLWYAGAYGGGRGSLGGIGGGVPKSGPGATGVNASIANKAGSIRNVNPTRGTKNCVNCSIATDATLAGRPASALPGIPTTISALEKQFGGTFRSVSGQSQISTIMSNAGPGARGIVFGESKISGQPGHVFNVVNQKGTIRFLDGQNGGPATFNDLKNFQFLPTN